MIYIFLITIIITILFNIINNLNKQKKIEYFYSWDKSEKDINAEEQELTNNQIKQVESISAEKCKTTLTNLVQTQSPLITGPTGKVGPPGPPGTTLIASGKLANKQSSFSEANKIIPQFVVSRSNGKGSSASFIYMNNISPFASYQDWQYDINNNIKNRFDSSCMTMSKDKIYMDDCDSNNANQKWTWDDRNRLYSKANSTKENLKCIAIKEMDITGVTSEPNCIGKECDKSSKQKFLVVDDCISSDVKDNQVWGFT